MKKNLLSLIALAVIGVGSPLCSAQETLWGITDDQFLVSWQSDSPADLTFGTAITGLQANEQILGIDYRPADNQIYAIGSSNRLYTLGMDGTATQVGPQFGIGLDGSAFGYDFNPTIDRSRIDTNTNNNYVVNPNDGSIVQVTDVFFEFGDENFGVEPNVAHLGYTNSFDGANSTQLYAIDTGLDILATQANSAGTLNTVGELGIDITSIGGFDISGATDLAYGAFQLSGNSNSLFYTIDLNTGAASFVGEINGGSVITALTVQPSVIPEPSSALAIAALGSIFLFRRRRV